jgi:hypothetical protein
MKYIKKWIPLQRTAMLAGNSVHVDKVFLEREMPEIVDWLHYRSLGYSSPYLTLTDCVSPVLFVICSIVGEWPRYFSLSPHAESTSEDVSSIKVCLHLGPP